MSISIGELAIRFGCTLQGDPDVRVARVASLEAAGADSISFVTNAKYRKLLRSTAASAVIVAPELAAECPCPALLTKNPYATFARIATVLHPEPVSPAGVHPAAVVDAQARIDTTATIGPKAVIEAGAVIGPRVVIGPGCVIMRGAQIGADSRLVANVTVYHEVRIGERCLLHGGVVIGADGFGQAPDAGRFVKVPQIGSVSIGNDVEIGANTAVDRGAINDTVIEDGVKLDNLVQVGHNCRIGENTVMAGCSGVAGSTTIGKRCFIGGKVGIVGHLTICDDVMVAGFSMVASNIRKPGVYASGVPADTIQRFNKNVARFHQLDEFVREVRRRWRDTDLGAGKSGAASKGRPDDADQR
jgi:UDP-3-O-[3-hydroxymyristoyl] glucosamine N-acyltransferase